MLKSGVLLRSVLIKAATTKGRQDLDLVDMGVKPGLVVTYDLFRDKFPKTGVLIQYFHSLATNLDFITVSVVHTVYMFCRNILQYCNKGLK